MKLETPPCLRLLPPEIQAQFAQIKFSPRGLVSGFKSGEHRSQRLGTSTEFAEHREYSPGDDPADLDWRVFGKMDRYYIKQYVEETNLQVTIVIDTSASMRFQGNHASRSFSRFEYACHIAALLASIFLQQGDAVGLIEVGASVRNWLPTRSNPAQLRRILQSLHDAQPSGESNPAVAIHEIAERLPKRGVVFLISDWLSELGPVANALHHLKHRGHQISLFHVLTEEELTFPYSDATQFRDIEGVCGDLDVDPASIRRQYHQNLTAYLNELRDVCRQVPVEYTLFNTREAYEVVLRRYFAERWGGAG
ncbi:MAG: DUF58 domain-containing protein [Planctomycetaceae bacterium]